MHQAAGIAYRVLHQVEQRPAHVAAVQADLRRAIAVHYATHGARLRQVVDLRQRVAEPVARVDGFLRHHVVRRPFQTRVDQQFRHHAFQLVDVRLHVLQDMLAARAAAVLPQQVDFEGQPGQRRAQFMRDGVGQAALVLDQRGDALGHLIEALAHVPDAGHTRQAHAGAQVC